MNFFTKNLYKKCFGGWGGGARVSDFFLGGGGARVSDYFTKNLNLNIFFFFFFCVGGGGRLKGWLD